ncbi:transcription initiation factor TFIID subunit 1 isoform X1 [Brachionus plicatilis]|uniref:Transcription initiation factor TFIID subunit 1 isoform X1 n=1 Tax=Brachionus plicatilis TaxID=10195 RepID=A0A3M7P7D2_BRAPC|nr:transcription initiation factor TFIID subunit 1 isoform X1 [Brachionus plicatilis]
MSNFESEQEKDQFAALSAGLNSQNDLESVYILPKTYNGKTVTDLFPEFKYDSVLRFSKLFGIGRTICLPKTWRGTRKRRKAKSENDKSLTSDQKNDQDDVFQIFESDFDVTKKVAQKQTTPNPPVDQPKQDQVKQEEDDLEFEQSDEINFLKPYIIDDVNKSDKVDNDSEFNEAHIKKQWEQGPGSYWYKMYNLDSLIEKKKKELKKLKKKNKTEDDDDEEDTKEEEEPESNENKKEQEGLHLKLNDLDINKLINEDKFLLINTSNWENNIIIDPNNSNKINSEIVNERIKLASWVPSSEHRTLSSFQSKILGKKTDFMNLYNDQSVPNPQTTNTKSKQNQWSSIFPNENYDLYTDWEKNIIIDPENDVKLDDLKPKEFLIDPNDDNLLLGVPEDVVVEKPVQKEEEPKEHRKYERTKPSKKALEAMEHDHHEAETSQNNEPKSMWNVSNDEFYNPKQISSEQGAQNSKHVSSSLAMHHAQCALDLHPQFFPTHLSVGKLRNFHRMPLRRFQPSEINSLISVHSLLKKFGKLEPKLEFPKSFTQPQPIAPIEINQIRSVGDLTATDNCHFVLAEYSEQYPPLMMQPGMATRVRNFYKKKFSKDEGPQNGEYGDLVYVSSSPFLGVLKPGESLLAFENGMFRAPIYRHSIPSQDFLVIKSKSSGYVIRGDIQNLFVVGQECPLIEVPGPNSKRSNSFLKDFLQAYLVRLFNESQDVPKRIKMEDVKKAFPTLPENSIRKRLKICADFRRTGKLDTNWWILKEDIRLPTDEEVRSLIAPEQCCAYYSMLAAEQRLKDAGYGEKNFWASDDDDDENSKIDDEVKNAPWHTTRAYLDAIKGKCLLQINGVADPTGRGEGFSYVRQAIKNKEEEEKDKNNDSVNSPQPQTKRTVTGTDADLRKLHLSQAKELLASYGVPEADIKKLKRWEIIDVVRTMSTQKAKEGDGAALSKFARGNKYSQSDAHDKFKDECQRLFELQNRNLASEEYLSTDDSEDLDEDSDVDEMGKNLESMLESNLSKESKKNDDKSSSELKTIIMNQAHEKKNDSQKTDQNPNMQRILKISRTYRDEQTGKEYTKVETVTNSLVIDAYVKIRTTRDEEFIQKAFALDENEKEQLRKERRRLQEQLRRVKRYEARNGEEGAPKVRKYNKTGLNRKSKLDNSMLSSPEAKKFFIKSSLQYSSGEEEKSRDTGQQPQKRKYVKRKKQTDQQQSGGEAAPTTGLAKVEGTKLIIQKKAIKMALNSDDGGSPAKKKYRSKKALDLESKVDNFDANSNTSEMVEHEKQMPKIKIKPVKPDSQSGEQQSIVLTIPKDKIAIETENQVEETQKKMVNKSNVVKKQQKTQQQQQQQQQQQLIQEQLQQMQQNPLEMAALAAASQFANFFDQQQFLLALQQQLMQQQPTQAAQPAQSTKSTPAASAHQQPKRKVSTQNSCDYLVKPQKKVDRRHVDPLVSMSTLLENIVNELRDLQEAQPFLFPVNQKKVPDYYKVIKDPIDLQKIRKKINEKMYKDRESFLNDMQLLINNSRIYNGTNSIITQSAEMIYQLCELRIKEKQDQFVRLEKAINPLLDENSLIVLNYLFDQLYEQFIMQVDNSFSFLKPVNKAKYKDYYDIVKNPIDLEAIKQVSPVHIFSIT